MPVNVSKIGQIALDVDDVERATAFYRDVLGLTHLFMAPPGLSFFMLGETRLMLSRPEGGADRRGSVLYLLVADIDAAVDAIRGQTKLIDEPHLIATMPDHQLWMAFFEDSEGNTLAFMEERR